MTDMSSFTRASQGTQRRLWLYRPPKAGHFEDIALADGLLCADFGVRADLSETFEREEVLDAVIEGNPNESRRRVELAATQLHALLNEMQPGDLVLFRPRKRSVLLVGIARPGDATDPDGRPARRVIWEVEDLPRESIGEDILQALGSHAHFCALDRNDALARIMAVVEHGHDPGPDMASAPWGAPTESLEARARRDILERMGTVFSGHDLAHLAAALMRAEGMHAECAPPGPDGGVDIMAGSGPFGLGAPRLLAQVKSGHEPAGDPVLQAIVGAAQSAGADAALLVAWAGATRQARARMSHLGFRVQLWDRDRILDLLVRHYDAMPHWVRDRLPLRRVPVLQSKPS